jgi:hypothetical protein
LPALKEPTRTPRSEVPGHLFDPGGRRTLDDLLVGLLGDGRREPAACPVCEEPALSASPGGTFECAACGSRLD